jgi:beta-galactosidase
MAEAGPVRVRIGKRSGVIESHAVAGRELLESPLVPNFWRVPTDNDIGNRMPDRCGAWRDAWKQAKVERVEACDAEHGAVEIASQARFADGTSTLSLRYRVSAAGDVNVSLRLNPAPGLPEIPRMGMQARLVPAIRKMTWYGRGPHETYWDRRTGAAVGIHASAIADLPHAYARPQENGNRTDVRWAALTDADGCGVMALCGTELLEVSALPYAMEQLAAAKHINDLARSDSPTLSIDLHQMGVGGDTSWGARTHPQYTLPAKPCGYDFTLRAIAEPAGEPATIARGVARL